MKEAGPVSGFGQWVRVEHADGTITVYGHVNSYNVRANQRVHAGQVIARRATSASPPARTCTSRCGTPAARRSTR
ncbi:M23 family metallopeptidase [Lentzea sp.]|uniref:M23 family metallopeptidase n=1 Tax=Lentzea sp. TaxID=56099 RepID=UPI002ED4EF82